LSNGSISLVFFDIFVVELYKALQSNQSENPILRGVFHWRGEAWGILDSIKCKISKANFTPLVHVQTGFSNYEW